MAAELDPRDPNFVVPDTVEVVLKRPLKKSASDDTLAVLTFRTPTFKEIRQITAVEKKQGELAGAVEMLVLLSADKLVEPDIDRLTAIDFQLCVEAIGPFAGLQPAKPAD